jgi:hypothetical protein
MRRLVFFLVGTVATECSRAGRENPKIVAAACGRDGAPGAAGAAGAGLTWAAGWQVAVVIALTTVIPGRYPPLGVRSHPDVDWAPAAERAIGWQRTETLSRSRLRERVKSQDQLHT